MALDLRVPVQARSVRTRADIVAAARVEFSAHGYALTTAKSIAQRAKVGIGTFYHYFPDKDAVLREIVTERINRLEQSLVSRDAELQPNPEDVAGSIAVLRKLVRRDVKAYVEYHRADTGLHAVISERRLCDSTLDQIMTAVEQRGIRRTADALKRRGFSGDAQAAAFMIFSLLDGAVHKHVLGEPVLTDTRFIEALTQAIVSIGAPPRMLAALAAER